jgi:phosphotransferase system enzyme I (PtsI)
MAEVMKIKEGIAASLGFAIGPVLVAGREERPILRRGVSDGEVGGEVVRFEHACAQAEEEVASICGEVGQRVGKEAASIFQGHFVHLRDSRMRQEIVQSIRRNRHSAEYAVSRYFRRKIRKIEDQSPASYATRIVEDVTDIERRLLKHLGGDADPGAIRLQSKAILVAHTLTPAQTLGLDKTKVLGLLTDGGGPTSHTALLARAFGIPAVVGLETISTDVTSGDIVIVNGNQGLVVINPDEETLKRYREMERNYHRLDQRLTREYRHLAAQTKDGARVEVLANIELTDEIPAALEHGAEGVGLYRTEFLYLERDHEPTEEEQCRQYRKAAELLKGRKLVVRTMDLGMDKLPQSGLPAERNPYLGTRAIRLSLQRPDLFKTQLRAILRASAAGPVEIMFPMISSVGELREARAILDAVRDDLRRERHPFDENIPVGMMIEVPSAALIVDLFAPEVDFFSVGTNDLIQYAVAVDRVNERVAPLFQPAHPAILRLLRDVFAAAARAGKPVAVCGEMSSDIQFTLFLLGLGLKQFSVVAPVIPEIKKIVRSVTHEEARAVAEHTLRLDDSKAILAYLRERTRELIPELF